MNIKILPINFNNEDLIIKCIIECMEIENKCFLKKNYSSDYLPFYIINLKIEYPSFLKKEVKDFLSFKEKSNIQIPLSEKKYAFILKYNSSYYLAGDDESLIIIVFYIFFGIIQSEKNFFNLENNTEFIYIDEKNVFFSDDNNFVYDNNFNIEKTYYRDVFPVFDYSLLKNIKYLSKEEAVEDIEMLEYLIHNVYAGKNFFFGNKKELFDNFSVLKNQIKNKISTIDFEKALCKFLKKINDGHLVIYGHKQNIFQRKKSVFFSNIIVKKKNKEFFVVFSGENDINIGDKYTDDTKYLFKTFPVNHEDRYIVGILSKNSKNTLNVSFNKKIVRISLHKSKTDIKENSFSPINFTEIINNYLIINLNHFVFNQLNNENDFYRIINECKNYQGKIIIFNLLNNIGGDQSYLINILKTLEINYKTNIKTKTTISPITFQFFSKLPDFYLENISILYLKKFSSVIIKYKSLLNKIICLSIDDSSFVKMANSKFDFIFILNKQSASTAELIPTLKKFIPNVLIVGSNTSGTAKFGGVKNFLLNNSKIKIQIPENVSNIETFGFKEGEGFKPDYWIDSDNPVEALLNWIKVGKNNEMV